MMQLRPARVAEGLITSRLPLRLRLPLLCAFSSVEATGSRQHLPTQMHNGTRHACHHQQYLRHASAPHPCPHFDRVCPYSYSHGDAPDAFT